jgi:hypothetical protein
LLKGDSFTFLYTINSNGLGIKTRILINTRANGYAFINTDFVPITDYIELIMLINKRQLKVYMLVVKLKG